VLYGTGGKMMARIFFAAPNYLMAFAMCMALTVMAALTKNPEWYWLLVSDMNVAIWLLVAYWFDPNKK
jgi:hypothetical protein